MGEHSKERTGMLSKSFWMGALDRAVKTAAQALLTLWGSSEVLNILDINVVESLGVAAGMAVLSLLTSVASAPAGDKGSSALLPGAK